MAHGQLRLLLWKDWLIRKRKLITLGGIIWATLVVLSLYIVRANIDNQDYPTCQYSARALPSAGMLSFLQSFVCNINNECSPMDQFDEIPTYENSRLTQLQRQFSPLLYNASVIETAGTVPNALKLLGTVVTAVDEPTFLSISKNGIKVKDLFQNPKKVKRNVFETKFNLTSSDAEKIMQAEISLQGLLQGTVDRCNAKSLLDAIRVADASVADHLSERMCAMTDKELRMAFIEILFDVDFSRYVKMLGTMYSRLNGDQRLSDLADTLKAVLRVTRLDSFVPAELAALLAGAKDDGQFRYFNLTIVSNLISLFEPTFKDTESFKSVRGVIDAAISGLQWLYKLYKQQANTDPVGVVTGLVLQRIDGDFKLNGNTLKKEFMGALEAADGGVSVDDIFDVLPKITTFVLRWLSKPTRHNVLFYCTLLAQLVESADRVLYNNMNLEQIVYNASIRHPGGVKILKELPVDVVEKAFEGLTDANRTQFLTSKINAPEQMFCDANRLSLFFNVPKAQAELVKQQLCIEEWNSYVADLVKSFGIFEVKNNINTMASLLIQETLGKDTTDQLYTVEQSFDALRTFTKDLLHLAPRRTQEMDWESVLGMGEDGELVKLLKKEGGSKGKQVLITVHGALAKEVVKQNTILDIKISPILKDISTMVSALNQQLGLARRDVIEDFKMAYPHVLQTLLTTLMDEDKTYALISTHNEDMFCNDMEIASKYLALPSNLDADKLIQTLCEMTREIEKGLTNDSAVGIAFMKISKSSSQSLFGNVDWTILIEGIKSLYMTLHRDYTYLFEFATFNMDQDTRNEVQQLLEETKAFWFGRSHLSRSVQLSVNTVFRILDLLDRDIFQLTNEVWSKLKYSLNSANGLLLICDEIVRLITALSQGDEDYSSGLPPSTVVALRRILPNTPDLIADAADIIISDQTDLAHIISLLNMSPAWPCSTTSLSEVLTLRPGSVEGIRGLESVLCLNTTFTQEWQEYQAARSVRMITSFSQATTTKFAPHLFLKVASNFNALVKDAATLKTSLESLLAANATQDDELTFMAAWKYAVEVLNKTGKEEAFKRFFSRVDTVINSIDTSSTLENTSLNTLWEDYTKCDNFTLKEEGCRELGRGTWKHTVKYISVVAKSVVDDLLTYFKEINAPDANFIRLLGFTKYTGLYILYEKFADFMGVLLNSYWDYGFMNQIRRASQSQFWDCEGVLEAMVIPPGSRISLEDIRRVRPYICPSLLYWVSLPRGENSLLDVVSKPQYYFFTFGVENLTSNYEQAFDKFTQLTQLLTDIAKKNSTKVITEKDIEINSLQTKVNTFVDSVLAWKLNETDASYILFNEINRKQFISSIYLTRVITIISKIQTGLENLNLKELLPTISDEDISKLQADLQVILKKFKRRPSEVIALHFDMITKVLWENKDEYQLVRTIESMCEASNETVTAILAEDRRFLSQICSKNYKVFYGALESDVKYDFGTARRSLDNLIGMLKNPEDEVSDVFQFFDDRKELTRTLKLSTKYADDLGLPYYVRYLQMNLHHYNIILSFLNGEDWWTELRALYNGPNAETFFEAVEMSVDIVQDLVGHMDQIHLVRLLRDVNINDTASFCQPSVALSDYIPDGTGKLSALKTQACDGESQLIRELPVLLLVSQGYDNNLKLSKEINYTTLSSDMDDTEFRLNQVQAEPRPPQRPGWITDEKLAALRMTAEGLLSKEMLTKMAFGAIGNIVDGSTLFLNNSQCSLCSVLTTWFKQLGLQLVKKREYDLLLCRLPAMSLPEVHRTLTADFHWDMALKELISTRNYTNLELNKAANEFLEQLKLHVLDDLRPDRTKLSECLAHNVTTGAFGNASLILTVLSQTLKLVRAQLPHLQNIPGMKELPFLKQLQDEVAHNLHVERRLKDVLKEGSRLGEELNAVINDIRLRNSIEEGVLDLYALKNAPDSIESWLRLKSGPELICAGNNCTNLAYIIESNVDTNWTDKKLSQLQTSEFWRFNFIAEALARVERLLSHVARLFGVASRMDIMGALQGHLAAILDLVLQIMQKDVMEVVLFSLRGFAEELHPLLKDTFLEFDMLSLVRGLDIAGQYKAYIVENVDLKLDVSKVFSNPERIEAALGAIGVNHTNFWSLAAPGILAGQIDLMPLINSNRLDLHVASFVCRLEDLSQVVLPADVTQAVTSDDMYGALIEQFCSLDDERAKEMVPVLMENLNFSFVVDKVMKAVLTQVYAASNLTETEGSTVLAKYQDMLALMPVVQNNVGNLSEMLAKEPLFEAFQGTSSLSGLLSSSKFLESAGNMVCGKPFVGNDNRFYKAIAETKDFSNEPDPAQLEVLPTDFCRSLYQDVIKMGGGKIIWSFVKPLILGKILYTPSTPMVEKIIEKANTSFALMAKLADMVHDFAGSFPSVERLSDHRQALEALQALAAGPLLAGLGVGGVSAGEGTQGVNVEGLFDDFGDLKGIGSLLSKASDMLRCINLNRFHAAPDEQKLSNQAVKLTRVNEFAAGLVFMNIEEQYSKPVNVEYKIRMDIESVPTTARIRNQFWTPGPEGNFLEDMRYFRGFVQIQDLVDSAIISLSRSNVTGRRKRETESIVGEYGVYTQQIPYPCYRRDYFQSSLYESQALIVAFFFSLVFSVSSAIRFIVAEKESGNTMLMSVMGVDLTKHTLSWFLASLAELLATCACVAAVLRGGGVLPRSDWTLLYALMVDFSFAVLMFCYLVSKLFSSASLAAVCGALGYLLTFMPFIIILSLEAALSTIAKLITCLSMSTAFCYSLLHVARREAIGDGAHWADLWRTDGDSISIGTAALMVLLDGLIYLAIGCVIDRFYGIKALKSNISTPTSPQDADDDVDISIVNVSKQYAGSTRHALRDVTLQLRRGQVTALLGHNGAGKSTLIKIMTGMLRPTSGHVAQRARRAAGVCPQRDVLLPALSAAEHVRLYAQLKSGKDTQHVQAEVDDMLTVLSLGPQSHIPVSKLSGGQRRRVCVALAFVARPQLVLLDEPSSGVDPLARRDIWSLIVRLKKSRTVLLTTHHLDEAELLSDRLVVMHQGQIHTIGSPIEIKRSLGNGYSLTVTYPHLDPDKQDGRLEECSKKLLAAVRGVVKNGQVVEANGLEVEVNLPFYDADGVNNNFLMLCQSLESKKEELGYKSFSLDCSSLEQIMHSICGQPDTANYGTVSSHSSTDSPTQSASSSSIRNDQSCLVSSDGALKGSCWAQFQALLYKRFLHYSKNRWLLFLLLVLPSLFVSIAMAFSMIRPPADAEVALKLHPDLYVNATQFTVLNPTIYSNGMDPAFPEDVMSLLLHSKRFSNWTNKDSPSCSCADARQVCERTGARAAPPPPPPMLAVPDVRTLNNWLVTSQEDYIEKRYGGFTSALKNNLTAFVAWYNNKGHHALPSFLNGVNSALLKTAAGSPDAGITTYTHPLKISHEQLSKSTLLQHVADAGISGMLLLAYSLIPAGAAIYLVQERTGQQKRLQLLCGVPPALYWAAALLWDMLIIVVNIALTACVLSAFGFPVFVARDNLPAICLLLFLFGLSCTSLVHVLENVFTDASMANMVLFCANTFAGLSGLAVLLILDIISESEATDNARWTLHKIFLLSPQFALGDALVEIARNTVQAQVLSRFGMDTYVSPLYGPLVQYHYVALVLLTVVFQVFLQAREHGKLQALSSWWSGRAEQPPRGEEDPQVAAERFRVETSLNEVPPLRLQTIGNINAGYIDTEEKSDKKPSTPCVVAPTTCDVAAVVALGKRYGPRVAVANLTLGIPAGQCTALLGENGAGKSSTFSMLTGETRPSWGRLYLRGVEVTAADLRSGLISYCPQSDAIDPLLTVEQTLKFYCRLRGIEGEKEVIGRTLSTFELARYRGAGGARLSGGNRRKLCAALAFMGRSALVLLDEPTSGMDPGARACVWRGARAAAGGARAVLLSTHALRDAQRLADRVALLRAGRLVALDGLDECIKRFGGGCVISVRARAGAAGAGAAGAGAAGADAAGAGAAWRAWRWLRARCPRAKLRAVHATALQALLPADSTLDDSASPLQLSDVFRLLAEMQNCCDIDEYTVNQSSLDEMFLNFTERSEDELHLDLEEPPSPMVSRQKDSPLVLRHSYELDSVTSL